MRLAILMTCHNRAATTLECLKRLMPQLGSADKVFLVNDGSTDGTGAKVRASYPTVCVIDGDGALYWAKGMRVAWRAALKERSDWDAYLWLNDDTMLSSDAMEKMLANDDGRSLVIGNLCDTTGRAVYGLNVNGWVNGNCVLVPRAIYESIGEICGEYSHAWADSDYACQVNHAGFAIVDAGVVGITEWHPLRSSLAGKSLAERWRLLFDPKGWNLHDLWLYRHRNWSVSHAVASVVHMAFHVLFSRAEDAGCSTRQASLIVTNH